MLGNISEQAQGATPMHKLLIFEKLIISWNNDAVKVMAIHSTRQMILCIIENCHNHDKIFCSFIYAANTGMERRILWRDLEMAKIITKGNPWVMMGDFNVTLKLDEHQDFINCVNNIEVDDVCWSGMHFTWIKSPANPATSILKKLDRVMVNEDFIAKYNQAYEAKDDEEKLLFQCSKVVEEIVQHFNNFLGKSSQVDYVDSLGSVFSAILSIDEANDMVKEVSDTEIKDVMFGIGDCKSPGPDVKDFFLNGKLPREVNSTLIALIPKVQDSKSVTDFRPIACCNVIYKCISRILTNRIKGELLKGYNRKNGPKICSLKFDIAKAYDTIGFLLVSLHPTSLYALMRKFMEVFTLIMEHKIKNSENIRYHLGCKDLKLTHLWFADDLLVLCHGDEGSIKVIKDAIERALTLSTPPPSMITQPQAYSSILRLDLSVDSSTWFADVILVLCSWVGDEGSIKVIKDVIDDFSRVSGLVPNLNKSTIFFRNVNIGTQRRILNIVPFKLVKCKVNDWKNKYLSYAGRVQLIASVLGSMQIYWVAVFLLPKSTVKDIEKVLKGFLWCQGDLARGKAKIAWKTLCRPKSQDHKESLWVKWVHMIKLNRRGIWEVNVETNDSWIWKALLSLRKKARKHIEYKIDMIDNDKWKWHNEWKDVFP
ncbi:RNA-directed DNA polymerase, eukaryota, reverse transcriptase zinc-binding domain protein, partial [Tanacetum coccineum]